MGPWNCAASSRTPSGGAASGPRRGQTLPSNPTADLVAQAGGAGEGVGTPAGQPHHGELVGPAGRRPRPRHRTSPGSSAAVVGRVAHAGPLRCTPGGCRAARPPAGPRSGFKLRLRCPGWCCTTSRPFGSPNSAAEHPAAADAGRPPRAGGARSGAPRGWGGGAGGSRLPLIPRRQACAGGGRRRPGVGRCTCRQPFPRVDLVAAGSNQSSPGSARLAAGQPPRRRRAPFG